MLAAGVVPIKWEYDRTSLKSSVWKFMAYFAPRGCLAKQDGGKRPQLRENFKACP
jgi:hypothetical protein